VLGSEKDYCEDYGYGPNVKAAYKFIVDTLCREYGMFHLTTDL